MQFLLACTRAKSGQLLFLTGQRNEQPSSEVAVYSVKKGLGTLLLLGALCESVALSPYSSTGFVLMRLYNYLTQCNSTTAKQVIHADV